MLFFSCDIYTKGADTAALTADYEAMDKYLSGE